MKTVSVRNNLSGALGLHGFWWDKIEGIADKLLETYRGNPNKNWWSKIITEENHGSGNSQFKGWFMVDLMNVPEASGISDAPNGLVCVPIQLTDGNDVDQGTIIAGMVGYILHPNETSQAQRANQGPYKSYTVEATHGWTLLLDESSFFRQELLDWEQNINQD